VFDVDLHEFKIKDDRCNMIMDDVLVFKVISMNEEKEEEIHL
jgi:hypothetical protein